ncbi:MAG TPA: PIN domain-containing protein [Thermoanaerobaculia bacterium]
MAYLVDTNVLVRLAVPADPRHLSARHAVEALEAEGLYAASQNFVELWNVITRPVENNGLGQTTTVADQVLRSFKQAFARLPEPAGIYDRWRGLVVRFGVSGVKVHDARLVALMLANDVVRILTFNTADFRRYEVLGIRAVEPEKAPSINATRG